MKDIPNDQRRENMIYILMKGRFCIFQSILVHGSKKKTLGNIISKLENKGE
jgi:hypothetical protein